MKRAANMDCIQNPNIRFLQLGLNYLLHRYSTKRSYGTKKTALIYLLPTNCSYGTEKCNK